MTLRRGAIFPFIFFLNKNNEVKSRVEVILGKIQVVENPVLKVT